MKEIMNLSFRVASLSVWSKERERQRERLQGKKKHITENQKGKGITLPAR